jgi:glycosyltransferase involved in cell wall biosynthesis
MHQPSKKILVATGYYLPGFKGGGPIRSLSNLVDRLGDEFAFQVVTRDRDSGDTLPYRGSDERSGCIVGKARVFYLAPPARSFSNLRTMLRMLDPDVLYLNSFFSVPFAVKLLVLHWLGAIRPRPVIVAPRGEFSPGALAIKPLRKRLYIAVVRLLGICRSVVWQASSLLEREDIRHVLGKDVRVVVAPDLPAPASHDGGWQPCAEQRPGRLRILFLSRISPIKNLHGALALIDGVAGEIQLNIYGPVKDAGYWKECRRLIAGLPANIRVEYRGAIPHDQVGRVFGEHDLLFLPSLGENFGHVIIESLQAGCPVLISDRTPWRGLEQEGAGWDLSLDQPRFFQAALERCLAMGPDEYRAFRRSARAFALRVSNDEEVIVANRALFAGALE